VLFSFKRAHLGRCSFQGGKGWLPIVASLAAALSSGIAMAEASNLTLAGFVRGKRLNVYTVPERIVI
jgi:FdhD protein